MQLWEVEAGTGINITKQGTQLLCGTTRFLSPLTWTRVYLPFKLEVQGGVTLSSALQRDGLISGAVRLIGGMMRLDVFNANEDAVKLTPKTQLATLAGYSDIQVLKLAHSSALNTVEEITTDSLAEEIKAAFPQVGDLSSHPVVGPMHSLVVRAEEMQWTEPNEQGMRTPFVTEKSACRHKVSEQLQAYIDRGYLRKVSCGEKVYLSPLLPLAKKDGSYRFTNDFRMLNAYFKRRGMEQIDVWRRLWDVGPNWRYFAKLDLKDGFFGIPVDATLQRAFAFTWQDRRYTWQRLPMGWTWSPVLFAERVAEIVDGLGTVQFVDDLLIGADTRVELRRKLFQVFQRLQTYGLKVNLNKTEFLTTQVKFLGIEISQGSWSLRTYFHNKFKALDIGQLQSWKQLERLIGMLSYARKTVVGLERILATLRSRYQEAKQHKQTPLWWKDTQEVVRQAIFQALDKQVFLRLPGVSARRYVLETDWSGEHAGYMLFAEGEDGDHLCDLGSKRIVEHTSSFLGELKALTWACRDTKAFRGSTPLLIRTDNLTLAQKLDKGGCGIDDKRASRLFGWLLGNEDYQVEFIPGAANTGADLLSRPRRTRAAQQWESLNALTAEQEHKVAQAHAGHWNWKRTLANLKNREGQVWPNAAADVRDYVNACPRCRLYGKARTWPVWQAWACEEHNEYVFADFIGPLRWSPHSDEAVYVLILIEGLSRYIQLTLCDGPTAQAAKKGVIRWCRQFGAPAALVSDQGQAFMANEFTQACEQRGITLYKTAAYAHWSNGLCERAIGTVLGRIRREGNALTWSAVIRRVEKSYNESVHSGTSYAPKTVMTGTDLNGHPLTHAEWATVQQKARAVTLAAQAKRRLRHEKRPARRPVLDVGDQVYARTFSTGKLDAQWAGPYEITQKYSDRLLYLADANGPSGPWHAHQLKLVEAAHQ